MSDDLIRPGVHRAGRVRARLSMPPRTLQTPASGSSRPPYLASARSLRRTRHQRRRQRPRRATPRRRRRMPTSGTCRTRRSSSLPASSSPCRPGRRQRQSNAGTDQRFVTAAPGFTQAVHRDRRGATPGHACINNRFAGPTASDLHGGDGLQAARAARRTASVRPAGTRTARSAGTRSAAAPGRETGVPAGSMPWRCRATPRPTTRPPTPCGGSPSDRHRSDASVGLRTVLVKLP